MASMLAWLFLLVGFFQHGPVLPGNHTVNTVGFLEVLQYHSVSHQRHQLSTTTHINVYMICTAEAHMSSKLKEKTGFKKPQHHRHYRMKHEEANTVRKHVRL